MTLNPSPLRSGNKWVECPAGGGRVDFLFEGGKEELSELTVTVNKTDGGDVSGVPVTFSGGVNATLHTNGEGKVTLHGLNAGTYSVDAANSGYSSNGPKEVVLATDTDRAGATITLTPVPPPPAPPGPGAIHGKVIEGGTSSALPGALVKLREREDAVLDMAVADSDGEFAFDNLEPGSYRVTASLAGYTPDIKFAEVADDAVTIVEAVLAGVVVITEPPVPPAEAPDLPKTGAGYTGIMFLSLAAAAAGYVIRRR